MSIEQVVTAASDPLFYMRVSFLALKAAQQVAAESPNQPNHANRVNYAVRVLKGDDNAILLAQHVAASNPTITAALEEHGPASPADSDIEYALASIWDARANAFYQPPMQVVYSSEELLARIAELEKRLNAGAG